MTLLNTGRGYAWITISLLLLPDPTLISGMVLSCLTDSFVVSVGLSLAAALDTMSEPTPSLQQDLQLTKALRALEEKEEKEKELVRQLDERERKCREACRQHREAVSKIDALQKQLASPTTSKELQSRLDMMESRNAEVSVCEVEEGGGGKARSQAAVVGQSC